MVLGFKKYCSVVSGNIFDPNAPTSGLWRGIAEFPGAISLDGETGGLVGALENGRLQWA